MFTLFGVLHLLILMNCYCRNVDCYSIQLSQFLTDWTLYPCSLVPRPIRHFVLSEVAQYKMADGSGYETSIRVVLSRPPLHVSATAELLHMVRLQQ